MTYPSRDLRTFPALPSQWCHGLPTPYHMPITSTPRVLGTLAIALALAACDSTTPGSDSAPEQTPAAAGIPDLALSERALDLATPAPPFEVTGTAGEAIPGQYIVVLAEAPASAAAKNAADLSAVRTEVDALPGASVERTYEHAITGMAATLTAAQASALEADPRVAYVEPDRRVVALATQSNAPWGLDRVDQRSGTDGLYTYNTTASGVTAYIVDTGIRTGHVDFGGRARNGYDAFGGNGQDCNGHGTHVAGTVGGSTYGVAKGVELVGVRVLDCNGSGSTSGVIAGVDWVASDASGPSVANMSLGGGASTALDAAVRRAISSGITFVVAAGNENQNACNASPARTAEALTVGASDSGDRRASFSNYGSCVDLFAPGVSIRSAWSTSNTATRSISGTSMAAPHVAGAAALILAGSPGASPAQVSSSVLDATTKNAVSGSNTANNDLLYTGSSTAPPPPPPPSSISLSAGGRYWWGYSIVDLSWSGAASQNVDVYVNGSYGATTANDGAQSFNLGYRARGTYTFVVCESGSTSSCSNAVSLRY